MGKLTGKTAIVTGAAVGMGREIALAFAAEGANVVVNYSRSKEEAESTAEGVRERGAEALIVQADVADDAQVRAMVQQTIDRFGGIDVLVNNAGITIHVPSFGDLEALSDDLWDRLYDVNVKGTFHCCRAVAEPMKKAGAGRIINIASVAGIRPQGSSIAYSTSKAAVIHMSRCLAKALGPEITLNVVAPGFIDNTRWNVGRPNLEAMVQSVVKAAPLGRIGQPQDVVEAVLFLATSASYMTGSVMTVDGGRELT